MWIRFNPFLYFFNKISIYYSLNYFIKYFSILLILSLLKNVKHLRAETTKGKAVVLPLGEDPNPIVEEHRKFVKEMMKHSWNSYRKYAWGWNELSPISKSGTKTGSFDGNHRMGASIVESLGTLFIMNMKEEFNSGRDWIESNFDFSSIDGNILVFTTVIKYLGALLSAFTFTNDQLFLKKAKNITNLLLPAFNTKTGIPHALIVPKSGFSQNYHMNRYSVLSEFGSLHLEFVYLSAATGDTKYAEKVRKIRHFMNKITKPNGMYYNYVDPNTGYWGQDYINIGAGGDSFYEYLLSSWIQSNFTDIEAQHMFYSAIDAIEERLVLRSHTGLTYLAMQDRGQIVHRMGQLTCFAGAMYAQASFYENNKQKKSHYLELGINLTYTCQESFHRTATGLGWETFLFTKKQDLFPSKDEMFYILRPKTIQSYFYLWRLTHEQRYRDYAWSAAQAIGRYCRNENGFVGISNVSDINSKLIDNQPTYFLSETLKYLYLIFSTDDLIPFSEWVFNAGGHPLPILSKEDYHKKESPSKGDTSDVTTNRLKPPKRILTTTESSRTPNEKVHKEEAQKWERNATKTAKQIFNLPIALIFTLIQILNMIYHNY